MSSKAKVTNGIIKKDDAYYMQCGASLVKINFIPLDGKQSGVKQNDDKRN